MPTSLKALPIWKKLEAHAAEMRAASLRNLFASDPRRAETLSADGAGIFLDYSKNLLTSETMQLLEELAEQTSLHPKIRALFAGERVNVTENRPALHMALRLPKTASLVVDGKDLVPQVHDVLDRMSAFASSVRDGEWRGHTGWPMRNIINIGIGGSDLGPRMATEALRFYANRGLRYRFVSNVDGTDLSEALRDLDPAETLFIISSKTFTTTETLANARAAREWALQSLKDEAAIEKHFVAVSTNAAEVAKFGIAPANRFEMWDWVGGRYSLGSAIGLSLLIAIGEANFRDLLSGMHEMDDHFRTAPVRQNLPLLLGLIGIWHSDFFGCETTAILPYDEYLAKFPSYLQQLVMESNGKSVRFDGTAVDYRTGEVVWGSQGTNAQHAYFQLLHQGTEIVPCDFIGFERTLNPVGDQHDQLMANLFAQCEALAFGRDEAELASEGVAKELRPHRTFSGNRPSNVLLMGRLTPKNLGRLIALYEHRVFTQGAIWDIDSFDQWGVELGKKLATRLHAQITDVKAPGTHDASTDALLRRYRAKRAATGIVPARLVRVADASLLARRAATEFVEIGERAIAARGRFSVALSGGSTPRATLSLLSTKEFASRLDWTHVHLFWCDERCVSGEDEHSNYRMTHEMLIRHVPIPANQIHRIIGEAPPAVAALGYEKELQLFFRDGENHAPSSGFDLVWLGLGEDGHLASLFPYSPAIHETDHLVRAVHAPQGMAVRDRITLTPPAINSARHIQFLVEGAKKARQLAWAREGRFDPNRQPSQIIRPTGQLTWLVDEAAASLLTEK